MTLWPYPTTACGESRLIWKSQAASRTPNEVLDFWESAVKGINRSKTQADEGLGPRPKAGDTSRRSWLCRSASAPSQQACEPVQDRCLGPCSRPRHAAAWRSRKRTPAGWVAVEATSRPRQFGYETPQFRLERRLHAGSPYRSNDLVSASPEPPLSCDLRLNHAKTKLAQRKLGRGGRVLMLRNLS